jgi:hypothetical protein
MICIPFQILLKMTWTGHVACTAEKRNAYTVLVGKTKRKTQLGRSRCRWEDNIKMDLKDMGWRAWTGLIWLRIGTGVDL